MGGYATRRDVIVIGLVGMLLGAVLAAVAVSAPSADAADGEAFLLGKKNVALHITKLVAKNGLIVKSTRGVPLRIEAPAGEPPLMVNSDTWVRNLNADYVDNYESFELRSRSGSCWVEDAPEGLADSYICEMDAAQIPTSGIVHLMGSAEIWTSSPDEVWCYFEWKKGDGAWEEIHASRRELTAQPDYDICATNAVEWTDQEGEWVDYDFRFIIEGLEQVTDVEGTTASWIWVPWGQTYLGS
ncbi:MAG: hypothetical protein KQH83_10455 [Actinobacteria bacterium]|nr:hypothetical protein [Actinomycetota bacterium]